MTKLNFAISRQASKFLKIVPTKHARQLSEKIINLRGEPRPNDSKILIGHEPYCRVDVGEYRIIYCTDNETLFIQVIGKRNDGDVYKKMT